jgi:hypothetical protein
MSGHETNYLAKAAFFSLNKLDRILEAHVSDHTKIVVKGSNLLPIKVGSQYFTLDYDVTLDIDTDLDTGAVAAGTNYYVYALDNGGVLSFILSANSTYPAGYTANTSRKIGGFHTLCLAVGVIAGHILTGYLAKDIIPASIWDLKHRPVSNPEGMVYIDAINKWVDIYLTSGTGASTASVNGGTISDTRDWMSFADDYAAVKKQMLDDAEFQAVAAGSNEETNITGSADPVTTGGHVDTAGRRMISNYGIEDAVGAMWQWLRDQSYRFDGGAIGQGAAAKTLTITHAAAPGGNAVYLKFDAAGKPYLACNMATDAVDKLLTFGSAYTLWIKHEADPSSGTIVYFDEDATQPARLLSAQTTLKDVFIPTSNPQYTLRVVYNAAPGTPGVQVNFDDGADERLEFISPTTANGTLDLSLLSFTDPAWAYENLPGAKGSLYHQGTYGDVKLLAGGDWDSAAYSGSQARDAHYYRWGAYSSIGGRGRAEPL